MFYRYLIGIVLSMTSVLCAAQGEQPDSLTAPPASSERSDSIYRYSVELNGAASTGEHTPFWLANNRFGLSSIKKTNGYLRASFFREERRDKPFSWDFGVDLAVAGGYTSTFIIQQLYGAVHYRCLDLSIGSRESTSGMVNPEFRRPALLCQCPPYSSGPPWNRALHLYPMDKESACRERLHIARCIH